MNFESKDQTSAMNQDSSWLDLRDVFDKPLFILICSIDAEGNLSELVVTKPNHGKKSSLNTLWEELLHPAM